LGLLGQFRDASLPDAIAEFYAIFWLIMRGGLLSG